MTRLIDANTLKAEFAGNFHENWHYTAVRAMIDVAPTVDAVEVVRCKDCKYSKQITRGIYYCGIHDIQKRGEDFCSRAERKEE